MKARMLPRDPDGLQLFELEGDQYVLLSRDRVLGFDRWRGARILRLSHPTEGRTRWCTAVVALDDTGEAGDLKGMSESDFATEDRARPLPELGEAERGWLERQRDWWEGER